MQKKSKYIQNLIKELPQKRKELINYNGWHQCHLLSIYKVLEIEPEGYRFLNAIVFLKLLQIADYDTLAKMLFPKEENI